MTKHPKLPPRWFIRSAWVAHRVLLRLTGARVGMSVPQRGGRFGMLRLHTIGRRSGRRRAVVLGYIEDGDRLVTLAMNGWDPADPAWLLNLQANPEATADLVGGSRRVIAHQATGPERDRLWTVLHEYTGYGDLDGFAARRGASPPSWSSRRALYNGPRRQISPASAMAAESSAIGTATRSRSRHTHDDLA